MAATPEEAGKLGREACRVEKSTQDLKLYQNLRKLSRTIILGVNAGKGNWGGSAVTA
jgi:hypothetical protein